VMRHSSTYHPRLTGYASCVTFSSAKIVDYESFKENQFPALCELAWLCNMNNGIFMTPGREEQWTMSVVHNFDSVDKYIEVFDGFAAAITSD